jgi:hypothetical protein
MFMMAGLQGYVEQPAEERLLYCGSQVFTELS